MNFESANRVLCNFLQYSHSNLSSYVCKIEYGQCGQQLNTSTKGYALAEFPSTVTVRINPHPNLQQWDCYTITASNDTYTVFLKGFFSKFHDNNYYYVYYESFARRKFSLILPPALIGKNFIMHTTFCPVLKCA